MTEEEVLKAIQDNLATKSTELNLSGNSLTSLPPEIGQLTHLQRLNIKDNKLTDLPPEIGQLTRLQRIYLSNNKLTDLPPEIGQLTRLERIYAANNKLTSLPPEIEKLTELNLLYLRGNQLKTLPSELGNLAKLNILNIEKNPLPLPPEIQNNSQDINVILKYLESSIPEDEPTFNEVKIMVIGCQGVGKTSLIKRLVDDDFFPQLESTTGINLQPWQTEVNEKNIKVSFWDCGGKDSLQDIHQLFFTNRTIYLVVADATKGEKPNHLDYWLKMVNYLSHKASIIVVGNKVEELPFSINRSRLYNKYNNVKAFSEISCKTGQGIEQLIQIIQKEIEHLEYIWQDLPVNWLSVKKELSNLPQESISYENYQQICRSEVISNEESQEKLLNLIHDLGKVINCQNSVRLKDSDCTEIIDSQFLIQAVYNLISNPQVVNECLGIIDTKQISEIVEIELSPEAQELFVYLLNLLELSFYDNHLKKLVIPRLLSEEEITNENAQDYVIFEYNYHFLPATIFYRLMVKMKDYLKDSHYTRYGFVMVNSEGNKAYIKYDPNQQNIRILLDGEKEARREFLSKIRTKLDKLHQENPGIKTQEKIITSANPEIAIDYYDLLKREFNGEKEFTPPGMENQVNIQELLDYFELHPERQKRQQTLSLEPSTDIPTQPPEKAKTNNEADSLETQSREDSSKDDNKWVYIIGGGLILVAILIIVILSVSKPEDSQNQESQTLNLKSRVLKGFKSIF